MGYKTKEEQTQATISWQKRNVERVRATRRKSYQKHKERLREEFLIRYRENRKNPEWVEQDRARWRKLTKVYREKRIEWMKELKQTLKCILCGVNKFECLDFHHRNPDEKEMAISQGFRRWGKKKILEEISKCDVLCANCHRTHHYEEKINAGLVSV